MKPIIISDISLIVNDSDEKIFIVPKNTEIEPGELVRIYIDTTCHLCCQPKVTSIPVLDAVVNYTIKVNSDEIIDNLPDICDKLIAELHHQDPNASSGILVSFFEYSTV